MMSFKQALLPLIVVIVATNAVAWEQLIPRGLRSPNRPNAGGCYLQLLKTPSEQVFEWDFHDKGWINLGGPDLRLHLLSSRGINLEEGGGSIGQEQVVTFSGADLRVIVTMTLRSKCAASDESCEAVLIDGKIRVKTPKRSIAFPVKGICGT
jgi:hypothetical protein